MATKNGETSKIILKVENGYGTRSMFYLRAVHSARPFPTMMPTPSARPWQASSPIPWELCPARTAPASSQAEQQKPVYQTHTTLHNDFTARITVRIYQ